MSKGWDNATLKKLKGLMGKGLSTSEIGKKLGISKNAVVGKLNRLGWNAKAGGAAVAPAPAAKAATKKSAPATKAATPAKKATAPAGKKSAPVAKKVTPVKSAPAKKSVAPAPKKAATPKKQPTPTPAVPKVTKSTKTSSSKTLAMHQRIIQHSLEMANLKPNQCRWPIGDPDSENFHFCGETVVVGKPYCYEHCKQAYQFTPPKKK